MEVIRDFNDNMNPVAVVVTEWIDAPFYLDNFYTIITRDRFDLKKTDIFCPCFFSTNQLHYLYNQTLEVIMTHTLRHYS